MATIRTRQRSDGSVAFLAEIRIKRNGELVHRESRTFDRRAQANTWAESREKALAEAAPQTNDRRPVANMTLRELLKRYRDEVSEVRPIGRSKASNIRYLEKCDISRIDAVDLKSSDLIAHIRARRKNGAGPSTANNDLIWLRVILRYARAAWEIICRRQRDERRIFPFEPKSVGAAFHRACKMLDIRDLRFHDLRHEATSRLFEAGYSIVEVQQFTLHDSWGTLSRYTHLRPEAVQIR